MALDHLDVIEGLSVNLDRRTVVVDHHGDPAAIYGALDALRLDTTLVGSVEADPSQTPTEPASQRRALSLALAINAALFIAEFGAGLLAQSMGLIADALDMLADASVYALSLMAVGYGPERKRRLAAASGYLQLGLAFVGLVEVARRVLTDQPLPDPRVMIVVASIALLGNVATLMLLRRARSDEAHFQASWIFTANDIKVNGLVIAAAVLVAVTGSAAPDLVAGAAIFLVVANGSRRILALSRRDPVAGPEGR